MRSKAKRNITKCQKNFHTKSEGKVRVALASERHHRVSKYDDASWHSRGDFSKALAAQGSRTHIGMFLTWAVSHGLVSDELLEMKDAIASL
jgi:hypothetical protein